MIPFALHPKEAKAVPLAADTVTAAGYASTPVPVKLDPGIYVVDVTAPVYLRDAATGDQVMHTSGAVPLEFLLDPATAKLVPIKLEGDVLLAAKDGVACVVQFVPLIPLDECRR